MKAINLIKNLEYTELSNQLKSIDNLITNLQTNGLEEAAPSIQLMIDRLQSQLNALE